MQADLLALQDEFGANINALLCAAWMALQGQDNRTMPSATAVTQWNTAMTKPLRALRKQQAKSGHNCARLYALLKDAELEAERHEQALLVATLESRTRSQADAPLPARVQDNLQHYLNTLELRNKDAAMQRCRALLQRTLTFSPNIHHTESDTP